MRVSARQTVFCQAEPPKTRGTSKVRRAPAQYSSNSARAHAVARFVPDRIARQTLRLYHAALGHEGGARDTDMGTNTFITREEPALARS